MIPVAEPDLGQKELDNIIKVVKSGWISSKGEFVREFEQQFAKYCEVSYGVSVCNGTAALHLALETLNVKKRNEVIIPALTFIATANAVTYTGAKPIFVDSDPEYWCINPERIEEKITKNTKAIIPVHLYGHSCDMDLVMNIARIHNLWVIEDCAEGHGAEYKGRKVGSFGDISCFSFYGNKVITTGEGGMCLTNNKEFAEKMKIMRNQGMNSNKKYWHDFIGFNYRMTNMQAAIGIAQLEKLDKFIRKKRQIAKWYREELKEFEGKGLIKLSPEMAWARNIYWMYSILIEDKSGISRNDLMEKLKEKEIETRPFFYSIPQMPPYRSNEKFPLAEELSKKGLNLPTSCKLGKETIEQISNGIKQIMRSGRKV